MEANNRQLQVDLHLLDFPAEVLYGCVFPYLQLNDLLRLRHVCKPIKEYADEFIRNNFKSKEREINETDATFGHYLQRNLPTSVIYINNTGPEIFEDPDVPEFLRLFAKQITTLRVRYFSTCISEDELRFFSSLSNLQHLELEYTDATMRICMPTYKSDDEVGPTLTSAEPTPFPQNFKNLKTLLLNDIAGSSDTDHGYGWDIAEFCSKLEYLRPPVLNLGQKLDESRDGGPFSVVMDLIERRHLEFPGDANLKYYDLENYLNNNEFTCFEFEYYELAELCNERGVKLLNVPASLYDKLQCEPELWNRYYSAPEKFIAPLISLKNVHSYLFIGELPNLEKLIINSTSNSTFDEWDLRKYNRGNPEWPKLRILDITIDSESFEFDEGGGIEEVSTGDIFEFFFFAIRNELKELYIRFGEPRSLGEDLPIPKVCDITLGCSNITKLLLSNWLGTNKAVSMFWERLSLLEDVTLERCEKLSDVAFVGKRKNDPAFLKLKKLKKLTLKGLHVMPKVTDLIFKLVFRNLEIKQFIMQSELPLKSITIAGIQSLLTGNFNNSVEKFPFEGWSLNGVSEEEFSQLKSQFRASHML